MNTGLTTFVIALGEDLELRRAYISDPDAIMKAHGLTDAERAALGSGDEAAIYGAVGAADAFTFAKIIGWPKTTTDGERLKQAA